jgi:virginiamycin B lyase
MKFKLRRSSGIGACLLSACLVLVAAGIAHASGGLIEEFGVNQYRAELGDVAVGSEGGVWFLQRSSYEFFSSRIERIAPDGQLTASLAMAGGMTPMDLARGSDGNMWVTGLYFPSGEDVVDRITPTGKITEFSISTDEALRFEPHGIAAGAEGNMWFTERSDAVPSQSFIVRVTTTGAFVKFPIPTGSQPTRPEASAPGGIALGVDGNMWFTDDGHNGNGEDLIGRVTPTGHVTEFAIPTPNSGPGSIALGADGNMWFTEVRVGKVGRVTPSGDITEFNVPGLEGALNGIALGSDGNMWFGGSFQASGLGWITPAGQSHRIPASLLGSANVGSLAADSEGNIWFTDPRPFQIDIPSNSFIGRLIPPHLPANQASPTLTGETLAGSILTATPGGWSNEPSEFTYQWQACNASGDGCTDIPGALGNSYFLEPSDVGHTMRAVVSATNLAGASTVASLPSGLVRAPAEPPHGLDGPPSNNPSVLGVTMTWLFPLVGTSTKVGTLLASGLSAGTGVDVTCKGKGCPRAHISFTAAVRHGRCASRSCASAPPPLLHGELDLAGIFKGRRLRPGTKLTFRFTKPGSIGRVYFFSTRSRQVPFERDTCLTVGSTTSELVCVGPTPSGAPSKSRGS